MRPPRSRFITAPLLAALLSLAAGCATPPPEPSLYERLGGKAAIAAVVEDAFHNVADDPRINHRFNPALAQRVKSGLVELVCARTGGPCVYTGVNMADAHEGMYIRDDEFDALIEDMTKSFAKFKVPPREQRESLALLEQLRNAIVGH